MSSGEPVPGLDTGPGAEPGPLLRTLTVRGQVFALRRGRAGGSDYDWLSGPNEGYGFGSSLPAESPDEAHRENVEGFLDMIDPETGFIADD